jgi:integrase
MPKRSIHRLTKTLVDQAQLGHTVWDCEIPGFGLRVTSGGTRTFIFQFRTHTREQGRIALGRYPSMTVDEARRIARQHRVTVDQGGNPSRERQETREGMTLRELATYYCEVYAKDRGLKTKTWQEARRLLDLYALPKFGIRKVKDIKVSDIRSMHNEARKGAGRYQANRMRAALSRMFTLAKGMDVRSDNPCEGVEKFQEDQRMAYLSLSDVGKLLAACDTYPDQNAANAIRLLLFTGARLREVIHAPWSQFDLERGLWVKPSSHTKTKIVHRVYLSPETVDLLRAMRNGDPDGHWLFPGRDPSKPRHDLKRPWEQILKAAGIGHFQKHDLRRTTASFILSSGHDIATVGKNLGHTQASTTQRYAQLFEDNQRRGLASAVELMTRARESAGALPKS